MGKELERNRTFRKSMVQIQSLLQIKRTRFSWVSSSRQFERQSWYNQGMKRDLMDILACPMCKGKLELSVTEENEREIVTGSLYCSKCDVRYSIEDTIPNLLPPGQRH